MQIGALSQTFTIPDTFTSGAFVTSIDLFFAAKGAETLPVIVQIVTTTNGYPTQTIVANGQAVLQPANINVSTNGTVATRVYFPTFVYLSPQTQYAVQVMSNSVQYQVWLARLGDTRVDVPLVITKQPLSGSLFKSQNSSTWTPDQVDDLKFTLYYANFDTSQSARVQFTNSAIDAFVSLPPNPFRITAGSSTVRVYHPNHGLFAGLFVTYFGSTYTGPSGHTGTEFTSSYTNVYGQHDTAYSGNKNYTVVAVIDTDNYAITMANPETVTDNVGGGAVTVGKSAKFEEFNIQTATMTPTNTNITYTAKFTTANGKESAFTQYQNGVFNSLDASRYVHTNVNESTFLGNAKSIEVELDMYSNDPTVSPIVSAESASIALNSYKIDNRNTNIAAVPSTLGSAVFSSVTNTITRGTGSWLTDLAGSAIGSLVSLTFTAGTTNNLGTFTGVITSATVVTVDAAYLLTTETATVTGVQWSGFWDAYQVDIKESQPSLNTHESRYITIPVTLQNISTEIKVMFAYNIPVPAQIQLWYRSALSSATQPLGTDAWVQVNYQDLASTIPLVFQNAQGTTYTDIEIDIAPPMSFDTFQIKVVFLSTNPAAVPKVKDLRVIALA